MESIYERKKKFCNIDILGGIDFWDGCCGEFDFPSLHAYNKDVPQTFIAFNEALRSKQYDSGVHFFLDDYQFERIWAQPARYIDVLKKFKCVIAPDFSQYVDIPKAVNIWNIYRNRAISKYWVDNGINVIPSASWSGIGTWKYTLNGLPQNSVIAVGCLTAGSGALFNVWKDGVRYLQSKYHPSKLIVFSNYKEKVLSLPYENIVFHEGYVNKLRQL